jgi:hypothetical protein
MANGDKAAAAGLATWPSTADVRNGYDNLNVRGDELAEHLVNGGHTMAKITGLTAALAAKLDDSEASINATASTLPRRDAGGQLTVQPVPSLGAHAASKQYVDTHLRELSDLVDQLQARLRQLEGGS